MNPAGHKPKIVKRALSLHCWFCGAFPNEQCKTPKGGRYRNNNFHTSRMRDARAEAQSREGA
jgi:hypothetical protein